MPEPERPATPISALAQSLPTDLPRSVRSSRIMVEHVFRSLVERLVQAAQLGDFFGIALVNVLHGLLRAVTEQARDVRVETEIELVVEDSSVFDQGKMPISGAEAEQIAPQPRIEIGNPQQAQVRRQGIGQARGEVDAPAPLDQCGRVNRQRHVKTREPQLLPRRLPGRGVAVIPVHDEDRVAEVRGLARLFKEGLERVVEEPEPVVGREAVEAVVVERCIVHLRELEPPTVAWDRVRPVIPRGLDKGEERLLFLAERRLGFFEQNDVRYAPAVRLRRVVVAFLEYMQAGYVVREQAADISPGRAPAQKIIL